jgi:hypothetical protein
MARSGTKPLPPSLALIQNSKLTEGNKKLGEEAVPPDHSAPLKPVWLKRNRKASAAFDKKSDTYHRRNQPVGGLGEQLAVYCLYEVAIIHDYFLKGIIPPANMINTYRHMCAEFFDTPASQVIPPSARTNKGNPFNRNGQKK